MTSSAAALSIGGWRPGIGAWPVHGGFQFRVWAPESTRVELVVASGAAARRVDLAGEDDGFFGITLDDIAPGTPYGFRIDGAGPYPDPASRWQPQGVHNLSATVDPDAFDWSDRAWKGVELHEAVFYELHVGTFTPEGTFAAAQGRLPDLADLGVTVIELMPVADFPGARNWGYDGVSLFAPARCYGAPDDLRRLIDAAHTLGLAVALDVVYNHFGPDGAYAFTYSPHYASSRHQCPWGASVNFDGPHSAPVRAFFIENALHWLHEYHLDGLRLDATHAIADDSPLHFVAELTERIHASLPQRRLLIVAEDDRNLKKIVQPVAKGGWGCDAVWADDFHHQLRRLSAGDSDGYYRDFTGDMSDVAETIRAGWFYRGQHSAFRGAARGTDPTGLRTERMVACLQNHDQIGNRAFGERLNHHIDLALWRALSVVLLSAPETPLLFMGQEWAASTPFLYFTDHEPTLGRLVTEGRRQEFARFDAFRDEAIRTSVPNPQAPATFDASRLQWPERLHAEHAGVLALYRALLALRRSHPAMAASAFSDAVALDADTLALTRRAGGHVRTLLVVARLRGAGVVDLGTWPGGTSRRNWSVVLTSEDSGFAARPPGDQQTRPHVSFGPAPTIEFRGPGAVILEVW